MLLVAGQHQHGRSRGIGRRDVHDHVGEAGTFGAGAGGDLAGDARESVGRGAHGAFGAPAVTGNPFFRDGVDHAVISGAAEHRREPFFLADLGEHLRAAHRKCGRLGRGGDGGVERVGEFDGSGVASARGGFLGDERAGGGGQDGSVEEGSTGILITGLLLVHGAPC
jgi:hypothetical protein